MCAMKPEIIVAGGGISGAATALFLSRLDVNVTILENRPSHSTVRLGRDFDASSKRNACPERTWISSLIGKVSQGSVERYGFASLMVMRSDLHDVLLDEVKKRQLNVVLGAQVQSIEESDDGVLVRWVQDEQPREKKVDLLVGADGIWSTVRPSMYDCLKLSAPKPEYSGLVGIGMLVDVDSVPGISDFLTPDRSCVMIHGRLGFVGMALFDKERKKLGWWTTHEAPDRSREEWKVPKQQALREIRERYSAWAFPIPQLIAAAEASNEELFVWPVFQVRKLEHWHSRRTILIGDAAHAMPPHSGQGASQALEDAGYLAYLLRKQLESAAPSVPGANTLDWTSTLATFLKNRQPRVQRIVDEANRRGGQKKEHSVVGHFIKTWIMRILFFFMSESSGDDWFGYKVPGIDEW
ncbi:FAD/NAD(P)-binding domain-containing protein [Chiua virens]|nr:FAD/NAD(P)-binding domain-containing protein [Chiua virens]